MLSDIPDVLYKYRDWSNEYNRKFLTFCELYFSNNYSLNDPFDLQLPIRIPHTPPFDEKSFYEDFLSSNGRKPNELELKTASNQWTVLVENNPDIVQEFKAHLKTEAKKIEEKLGVFCLSTKNDSTLMWGHYANSHKGFCVGLDTEKLRKYMHKQFPKSGGLRRVTYQSDIPLYNYTLSAENILSYVNSRLITKFSDWEYESEVRIVIGDFANITHRIPNDIFTEVIFGFKMDDTQRGEIRNTCSSLFPDMKFFEAIPSDSDFTMKIVPV